MSENTNGLTGITATTPSTSEAQGQLDKMMADVKADPQHPFNTTTNPKAHREAYERMYALRVAASGEAGPTVEQRREHEKSPDVLDARAKLTALKAQIYENKKHPFHDAHHPDHKKVVQEMTELNKRAITGTMQELSPHTKAAYEALEGKAEEQTDRNAKARELIYAMKADGFEMPEGFNADDDIPQWQIEIWQMQHLNKKNNYEALTPLMAKHLKDLGATPTSETAFKTFLGLKDLNPDLKADIAHRILEDIYAAHRAREKPTA